MFQTYSGIFFAFFLLLLSQCDKGRENKESGNTSENPETLIQNVSNHDGTFEDAVEIGCTSAPQGFLVEFTALQGTPPYFIREVSYTIFAAPTATPLEFVVFESGETPTVEIGRAVLPEGSGGIGSWRFPIDPPIAVETNFFYAGLEMTTPADVIFGLDSNTPTMDSWAYSDCFVPVFGTTTVPIEISSIFSGHVAISVVVESNF